MNNSIKYEITKNITYLKKIVLTNLQQSISSYKKTAHHTFPDSKGARIWKNQYWELKRTMSMRNDLPQKWGVFKACEKWSNDFDSFLTQIKCSRTALYIISIGFKYEMIDKRQTLM